MVVQFMCCVKYRISIWPVRSVILFRMRRMTVPFRVVACRGGLLNDQIDDDAAALCAHGRFHFSTPHTKAIRKSSQSSSSLSVHRETYTCACRVMHQHTSGGYPLHYTTQPTTRRGEPTLWLNAPSHTQTLSVGSLRARKGMCVET